MADSDIEKDTFVEHKETKKTKKADKEYVSPGKGTDTSDPDIKMWDHPVTDNMMFHRSGKITLFDSGEDYPVPAYGTLKKNGYTLRNIHMIFAKLFNPNPNAYAFVAHIGDLFDHSPSNLKWVSTNLDFANLELPPTSCASDFPTIKHDLEGNEYKVHPYFKKWGVCKNGYMFVDKTGEPKPEPEGKYDRVSGLYNKVKKITWGVHHIVMELWGVDKKPEDTEYDRYVIDHIDGDTLNNDVTNLRWITDRENMQKAMNEKRLKTGSKTLAGIRENKYNQFTITFYVCKKQMNFGTFNDKEEAIKRRDYVSSCLKEGKIDELLDFHRINCKTKEIDYVKKVEDVAKWTDMSKKLTIYEKWNEKYPRYYGFEGEVYHIEIRTKMTISERKNVSTSGTTPFVSLTDNDWNGGYVSVADYMALVSLGPKPRGYQIRHLDGNGHNNQFENLQYVTQSDNIMYRGIKRKQDEICG
jgi:hypothetical protein